ncbi:hypothetical protein [uncultured Kriegella sp.]|uniref:hypothetical protein n=1 Tax=uncultured Kriegella sp. TaxID=1798910 RepID=UPI0030DDD1AE
MTLTHSQIQELYKFTRMHFVEHYDLQTELVDHLANGIEAQWEITPELTFNDALLGEFRKFGIGGFEKVVRKRQRAMEWRYSKIVMRFYGTYFKPPQILMVAGLILGLSLLLFAVPLTYRYDVILGLFMAIVAVVFFVSLKKWKDNDLECVKNGKKWMLKDQIYSYGQYVGVFNLFPIILNVQYFRTTIPVDASYVILIFASLIVCLSLLFYVTIFVIPKKAEELLATTYREYKIVS